ncbi:RNase P subunit p30 [Macleaya cordata]|uniref:RNase P subunit p30 n=1 Tax=Macleaya cordata TaxID=56857 RepID=A0A200R6A7_MACCD|nr:RNase P subunit p30 [Macleaya cordata]
MVFFDFNVPYLEAGGSEKPLPDNNARKNARLKIVVKAMELGYSGVAYNRSMKGVMSDSDRCTISLFPLSSLLKASPTLSVSVKFHRELLRVPLNSPFRQYTRLTVFVDNIVHAAALNSGNPVLKSYNLVAVKPLNQTVFDHACKVSEVDLIAIDFSEKLPFRLKLPMVKAAIKRGIYFEITYSHLISDVQSRRQMVTNAKLLVDWTRGKNLIFSSAASSANELRGPYDVANLSSLLGLTMERAKAAISKNCSSLIARALRRKQFYKEAIRVEGIPSGEQLDMKEPWFADCDSWDHISSGEGDLLLDDIAKFFSASSQVPKTSKSIDFASITEELPSHGMILKDWLPVGGDKLQPPDNTSSVLAAAEPIGSADMDEVFKHSNEPELVTLAGPLLLSCTPLKHQTSGCQGFMEPVSRADTPSLFTDPKQIETPSTCCEEPMSSNGLDAVPFAVETTPHDTPSQDRIASCDVDLILPDHVVAGLTPEKENGSSFVYDSNPRRPGGIVSVLSPKYHVSTIGDDPMSPMDTLELPTPSKEADLFSQSEVSERLNSVDEAFGVHDVNMEKCLTETEEREQIELVSAGCDMSIDIDLVRKEQIRQHSDGEVLLAEDKPLEAYTDMQEDVVLLADEVPPKNPLVELEEGSQEGIIGINSPTYNASKSGKGRFKHRTSLPAFPFPFKRILKPVAFKKKSQKLRNKIKML